MRTKNTLFSALTFLLFFSGAELVSRLFFVHPGTNDFLERRIIEQDLSKFKGKNEFRVLLFGESTMHGDAVYPKGSIENQARALAKSVLGERARDLKFYNLSRLGCNSEFIKKSVLDTLAYKPDLIAVYSAHNDFVRLEHRDLNFDSRPPRFGEKDFLSDRFKRFARQSAFLSELTRLYIRHKIWKHRLRDREISRREPELGPIREILYDPEQDSYEQDSPLFRRMFEFWSGNIREIVEVAQKKGFSVLFFEPVANFKEYSPNLSLHRMDMTAGEIHAWEHYEKMAEAALARQDLSAAARYLRRSLTLDPGYAHTYFKLAQVLDRLGDHLNSNHLYKLTNDKDRIPLRAPQKVSTFYQDLVLSGAPNVYAIRTQTLFESHSPNSIADGRLLLDTVHPTLEGQTILAEALLRAIEGAGLFASDRAWDWAALPDKARLWEELGIDKDFEFEMYLRKASFMDRYHDKTIEYANKALAIRPDSDAAKSYLVSAYLRKGEEKKAMDLLSENPKLAQYFDPDTLQRLRPRRPS